MAIGRVRIPPGFAEKVRHQASDPIGRDMYRRGLRVESAAKNRIRMYPRRIDTGRLISSIRTRAIAYMGTFGARVGTNVEYALFVHNGTRYMIANPYLRDALPAARD